VAIPQPVSDAQKLSLADWGGQFAIAAFEWIDGDKIMWSPTVSGSSFAANRLLRALLSHTEKTGNFEVLAETALAFTDGSDWVRGSLIPDLMVVSQQRLTEFRLGYPDWRNLPLLTVPEIAIEIISPTDRYHEVSRKTALYLLHGISEVWLIDWTFQTAECHSAEEIRRLTADDALNATGILPQFSIPLKSLFE
jgi:Uma2 family endonuclease